MGNFRIGPPGSGNRGGFNKDEHEGHLLAFVEVELQENVSTAYGDSDAAHVGTIVCLECMKLWTDLLIFGAALVPRLTEAADVEIVLGVLAKGEAKPGRSGAWLLDDPDDDEQKAADEFFDTYASRLKSGRIIVELPPVDDAEPF